MSNEEKILSLLTTMQNDMKKMQADIEMLKQNGNSQTPKRKLTAEERFILFDKMADLLTDDEKDALGRYQVAEEARKAALYG